MDTKINLPYQIGQKLYVVEKIQKYIKTEIIYTRNTPLIKEYYKKDIYKDEWIVERKFLRKIEIDNEGITWTFSNNENLTDNDEWDEDHCYKWHKDNDIYIFTNEIEADNHALSINCFNKITE